MITFSKEASNRRMVTLLVMLALILGFNSPAQSPTWTNITPPGWSGSFTQVTVANGRGFLALANNGYYYISPDTGRTWSLQATPDTSMIALAMYPGNTSGIMYNAATMYATTDAARTWAKLPRTGIPTDMIIRTVWAKNADTLLMAATNKVNGLRIFMSGNRGQTWKQVAQEIMNDFGYYNTINTFTFSSPLVGFGYGYGCYISTTDGGETWTNHINDGVIESVIGNYSMAYTYPSGKTLMFWCDYNKHKAEVRVSPDGDPTKATPLFTTAEEISSVSALGSKVYAVDKSGHFYFSNDSGMTWSSKTILDRLTNCNLFCSFLDENAGVAVSYYLTSMVTTDGGFTWTKHVHGAAEGLNKVYCKTEKECYMTGKMGRLFHTKDAGATWDYRDLADSKLYEVDFPTTDTGYVSTGSKIFRTIDGGETWVKFVTTSPGSFLSFPNKDTGYVGYSDGTIDRTTDAGQTWSMAADATYFINVGNSATACFNNKGEGVAAGSSGNLFYTSDWGTSWTIKASDISASYIMQVEDNWLLMNGGDVYLCDKGINCKLVYSTSTDNFLIANKRDPQTIYLSAMNDSVMVSNDGGNTWHKEYEPKFSDEFYFGDSRTVYSMFGSSIYKGVYAVSNNISDFTRVSNRVFSCTVENEPGVSFPAMVSLVCNDTVVYQYSTTVVNASPFTINIPAEVPAGEGYTIKIVPTDSVQYGPAHSTVFSIEEDSPVAEPLAANFTPQSSTAIQVTVSTTGFSGTCALLLSDAAGSFASATVVDTALLATGVATSVALPAGIAAGTGYKLRIVPLDSLHYLPCTSQAFAIATSAAGEPVVGDQPRARVVGGRVLCGCAGAEVFSSLGVRVPAGAVLPPGVYVARCGGRVTEVVVK